jgi:arginine deiminase
MCKRIKLNINSEIGTLKSVLLHKPGRELEKLTPDLLEAMLFDDIPWLRQMRVEHDEFADILRGRGAEVFYVEQMLAEVLAGEKERDAFIHMLLDDAGIGNEALKEKLFAFISAKKPEEIAETAISGLLKGEAVDCGAARTLWDYLHEDYPFYIDPIPNLYFMRDPAAVIKDGVSINHMHMSARRRESMVIRAIYENHPAFEGEKKLWYDYSLPGTIEGGDMLALSSRVIAIGCGQRTSAAGIEAISKTLFGGSEELREILVIRIPPVRAYMHLDTVFTMVDRDKFTIYPGIEDSIQVYRMERGRQGGVSVAPEADLVTALKRSLGLPAALLVQSGGGDAVSAAREQWNDSTNTLAIAPGVVVTYKRNERSNEILSAAGVEVIEIDGSELVRGRGGPRCMSCPLEREAVSGLS